MLLKIVIQVSLLSLFLHLRYAQGAKLPNYIKPCNLTDSKFNECVLQSAINAFPSVIKGDTFFKINSLVPLKLDQVVINVGESLQMTLNNLTITGIETGLLDSIKIDPDTKQWQFQLTGKHLTMDLSYDIRGRILLLPIVGNGPGKLSLENPIFNYMLNYELVKRKNIDYIDLVKSKFTYTTSKMNFHLENLFNGDERLGTAMNTFLNDNWPDVNNEIGPSIEETMNTIVTSVMKSYFNKIPMQNLFAI